MAKLVGRNEIARIFNCSPRWVSRLAEEHGMPKVARGQYDAAQCMLWYIRYLQKEMERRELGVEDSVGMAIRKERQRLVKAQADREEYELKQRRSQLIPAEVFEAETAAIVKHATQVLTTLSAIAPELEGKNRSAIRTKLDAAVREALLRLSHKYQSSE